jgi:hypothetical protein
VRNTTMIRLGTRLHPTEITDAWYAADCPPSLDVSGLSRRVRLQWRIACLLRGAKRS